MPTSPYYYISKAFTSAPSFLSCDQIIDSTRPGIKYKPKDSILMFVPLVEQRNYLKEVLVMHAFLNGKKIVINVLGVEKVYTGTSHMGKINFHIKKKKKYIRKM